MIEKGEGALSKLHVLLLWYVVSLELQYVGFLENERKEMEERPSEEGARHTACE